MATLPNGSHTSRTWCHSDALGSLRTTLNDAGVPQAAANYDAWGVSETPLLGSFGFTGALVWRATGRVCIA